MKHTRFEENILIDESYADYGGKGKDKSDKKKVGGIAQNFADSLEQYDERKKWYHQLPQEPPITKTLTEEQIEEMKKEANSALHGDTLAYENKSSKSGSSDQQWARTLMSKGAIGDRVAAATILIQDNPVHNLSALQNLINCVKPAKKKDGIVVIDALSELFVTELLIPDAKLRRFEQRPLAHVDEITSGNRHARKNLLKLWLYEHRLLELYEVYVESLSQFAHDSVDANKEKAVSAMSYLLMQHPEKEKILLSNIINKLGDPSQAVASKVIYHLCQLLYNHPNMKKVVLDVIEKLLFRTNISTRAQYYGVCFLNQFHLGKDDSTLAENLIRIYFSFFKASIKKGEIDSRLMSAILTGVKRAYPFADRARLAETERHVAAVRRIVHLGNFNVAVHALSLLYHVSDASDGIGDSYYTALYSKLGDARLFNTSHHALLFSLLYKSLKRDTNVARVAAFAKRLLQLATQMSAAQACGILLLLSQVTKEKDKKDVIKLIWMKEEIKENIELQETEADSSVVEGQEATEVSKEETSEEKSEEDSKENELKAERTRMDLLKGTKKDLLDDDSDEEYQDLNIDEEGNVKPARRARSGAAAPAGWHHLRLKAEKTEPDAEEESARQRDAKIQLMKTIKMDRTVMAYEPRARNPAFAGADRAAAAELLPLARHFHPSVKLFASKIIHGQIVQYSGDPLKDFAGVRFLERFAFKNPKQCAGQAAAAEEEGAVRQVRGSHPKFALRRNYTAKGLKSLPVTSASYLNEDAAKIPVDELFLYDYLRKKRDAAASDESEADSDAESVTSDDFNQYLDRVTATKPDVDSGGEEPDFMSEVRDTLRRRGGARAAPGDDAGGDADLDSEDAEDDEEIEMSANEDVGSLSGDEDELLLEHSDDGDQVEVPGGKSSKKRNLKAVKGGDDIGSLFASAEEFSTLLEETASNKKQGSSQAVSTSDNANIKQLVWEDKRDHWIKGYNRRMHGAKNKRSSDRNYEKGNTKSFARGNTKSFSKGNPRGNFSKDKNKHVDKKNAGKRKNSGSGGTGGKRKKM